MIFKNKIIFTIFATSLLGILGACAAPEENDPLSLGGADSEIGITEEPMDHSMMDHDPMNHDHMGHAMDLGEADEQYDLRFIDAMIPHHQGALIMSQEALEKSSREELQTLATEIIQAQQVEILQMQQWRAEWYPEAPATPTAWNPVTNQTTAMTPEQMAAMRMDMDLGMGDEQFELRFIDAMIPHHEAAVMMAQDALEKSDNPEIQALAQNIIDSQQTEIEQLQQWRGEWY
ncbi:MAG: DUF305 domain-containing protein [Cyanobacterium sp.]